MKRLRPGAAIAVACVVLAMPRLAFSGTVPLPAEGSLQALFTPWDDVDEAITAALGSAKKQVLVQAYLLTSKSIASTLIAAHRRGVEVRVLLDAEQLSRVESSKAAELHGEGIPVRLETGYQNAHNKIIIIDAGTSEATVITGSYNFTWTAQHRNAENILIARRNPSLAARYAANWERHLQQSTSYKK